MDDAEPKDVSGFESIVGYDKYVHRDFEAHVNFRTP